MLAITSIGSAGMSRTSPVLLFVILALCIHGVAAAAGIIDSSGTVNRKNIFPVLTILPTAFYSTFVGDSIHLDVSLPASYYADTTKLYRVVYLTDGYWRRDSHEMIHEMSRDHKIPELIIVGIGYPDGYDFNAIRVRDLVQQPEHLLSCIKKQVIPFVERTFRADSAHRTLWGSSFGGHFLIYAFTQHLKAGKLFTNYICTSPVLDPRFDHVDLLHEEQILWEITKELPVNLYMTVGELEESSLLKSYTTIADAIYSHEYNGLRFVYEVIPEKDHMTVAIPSLLRGLVLFLHE
jgi:predicted alpha/beta superfamily hydrolase